ncbi:hypothetical protein B0H66DRAFT_325401 [Apodospora peruviana]|uniref:Uncharacterized protein n=1 Tax=Apodospora peruviana TaxID=516989 RepID=A0AAE0M0P1_9PEZI|nr:hypothetical protein B0H66DRAFT_325401 [Apodospora peruviana]
MAMSDVGPSAPQQSIEEENISGTNPVKEENISETNAESTKEESISDAGSRSIKQESISDGGISIINIKQQSSSDDGMSMMNINDDDAEALAMSDGNIEPSAPQQSSSTGLPNQLAGSPYSHDNQPPSSIYNRNNRPPPHLGPQNQPTGSLGQSLITSTNNGRSSIHTLPDLLLVMFEGCCFLLVPNSLCRLRV